MLDRIVEAYAGEYAAGKSENALNRALELVRRGRRVTLVDLDISEPFFTLRPVQKKLTALGVEVIAWETGDTAGLGETGVIVKPEARWALRRGGDIILDLACGAGGARALKLLEGANTHPALKIIAVVNMSRPMTAVTEDIVEHIKELEPVAGIINNTHLGKETTGEVVQEGARVVTKAAKILGLPVIATAACAGVAEKIGPTDCLGNPIRPLVRFMQNAYW